MGELGVWSISRHLTRHIPRIFMLHRFSTSQSSRLINAGEFADFVDWLADRAELVTMRDLVCRVSRPTAAIKRPLVAITVDDGYADFYSVALPILSARRLPATVYVTAGFVNGQCWLWWDALRYLINAQPSGLLRLNLTGKTFELTIDENDISRSLAWSIIADYLITRNIERSSALSQLEELAGTTLPPFPCSNYAPMSWNQIKECEAAGVEIGCHTMTHAYLPTLDLPELKTEVNEAKLLLESHLNIPLSTFAYPNGNIYDWSPSVERAIKDSSFKTAVLSYPRHFNLTDLHRLGRWSVSKNSMQIDNIVSGLSALKLALLRRR